MALGPFPLVQAPFQNRPLAQTAYRGMFHERTGPGLIASVLQLPFDDRTPTRRPPAEAALLRRRASPPERIGCVITTGAAAVEHQGHETAANHDGKERS
jgi:hypothetical protein